MNILIGQNSNALMCMQWHVLGHGLFVCEYHRMDVRPRRWIFLQPIMQWFDNIVLSMVQILPHNSDNQGIFVNGFCLKFCWGICSQILSIYLLVWLYPGVCCDQGIEFSFEIDFLFRDGNAVLLNDMDKSLQMFKMLVYILGEN